VLLLLIAVDIEVQCRCLRASHVVLQLDDVGTAGVVWYAALFTDELRGAGWKAIVGDDASKAMVPRRAAATA